MLAVSACRELAPEGRYQREGSERTEDDRAVKRRVLGVDRLAGQTDRHGWDRVIRECRETPRRLDPLTNEVLGRCFRIGDCRWTSVFAHGASEAPF